MLKSLSQGLLALPHCHSPAALAFFLSFWTTKYHDNSIDVIDTIRKHKQMIYETW